MSNRSLSSGTYRIAILSPPNALQDTVIIVLCWVIASAPWLFGTHFIPYDSIDFYYPQSRFVVDALRMGDWPWWNPYQFSGLPVFGDPQGMLFVVHTLVGFFLGEAYTLKVFDIITLLLPLLGAFAIYAIGYSLKAPRAWLLLGPLVFLLGGVATSRLQHVTQIESYSLLPVLLYLVMEVRRSQTVGRAILLGLLAALWAANANQIVFLGGLLLIFVACYTLIRSGFSSKVLATYLFSAGISIVIVFPVYSSILEVVRLSERAELPIAMSAWASLPLTVYSSLVMPALYGNTFGPVWAPTDVTQDYFYVGLLPPMLIFSVAGGRLAIRSPLFWLWIGALTFFLLFSLGVNTPIYGLLYEHVPGFHLFRRPADAAFLVNMLLALGLLIIGRAASQYQANETRPSPEILGTRHAWMIALFVIVFPIVLFHLGAAAGAHGAMPVLHDSYLGLLGRIFLGGVLLLGASWLLMTSVRFLPLVFMVGAFAFTLDLSFSGRYYGLFSPLYTSHEVAPAYNQRPSLATPSLDSWLRSRTAPWDRVEIVGGPRAWGYSSTVRWHHTQGYNPIHLSSYSRAIGAPDLMAPRLFPAGSEGPSDWRFDVLGLRYVALYAPLLLESEQGPVALGAKSYRETLRAAGGTMVFTDGHYQVWERPGESLWLSLTKSLRPGDLAPAPCHLVKYNNVKLVLRCELESPGTLVLGEVYAPGWMACVNGRPAEVSLYSDVFRSVNLPAGSSVLHFRYYPVPFFRNHQC